MSFITNIESFVSTEWKKITGEATVIEGGLEKISGVAVGVVNGLKTFIASPTGQVLEDVIEQIPGISPYFEDVLNYLPELMVDLNFAQREFTKSPAQVVTDGITSAVNAANSDVKASNLTTIAAHVMTYISTLLKTPITIQTALAAIPAVYANITTPTVATT